MTIKEFEKAREIYRKYKDTENIIESINKGLEKKILVDKSTEKEGSDHQKWWQKLRFFELIFRKDKIVVVPHYEFANGIEVDADLELVELIIDYLEKKKDKYKQQMSEIGGINDEHQGKI